ncbi:MAG: hypothetical protein K2J68_01395 [Treponemataceae bacterium]|nr:hypothetical protein [Treponemataceae bacterium]MDE5776328.1 hypothetical protein [Treponemataceae bacterium]MDE6718499.1 hypothetical protein [Treponemataceae bacterium]
MEVLELKNIERAPGAIYYIRRYKAVASLKLPTEIIDSPIEFCIEMGPFGNKEIEIDILNQPNYPALPITKALREFILKIDDNGTLPI